MRIEEIEDSSPSIPTDGIVGEAGNVAGEMELSDPTVAGRLGDRACRQTVLNGLGNTEESIEKAGPPSSSVYELLDGLLRAPETEVSASLASNILRLLGK